MALRSTVSSAVNSMLGIGGLEVRSRHKPYTDYRAYIPLQETLRDTAQAGMSVGDYIDAHHNVPGATQATLDQMAALGVFDDVIERVCEIGPGSGRYLAKTLAYCTPTWYEVYETSAEWAAWLASQYDVIVQPSDGTTLAATESQSVDLVHAHKVMPGQPSLVMCRYFDEMARVVRPGGKVVFDIVTETCVTDDDLAKWWAAGGGYQCYPCLMPFTFAVDYLSRRGLRYVGSFLVPMLPGRTECMIFRRD